jgi:GntR family transcriptional regulator
MKAEFISMPRHSIAIGASEPLYKQVTRLIAERAAKGEWKSNEPLPTEPQLAAELGVSISTVRAAIAELVHCRLLVRRQGKGTFISPRDEIGSAYQFFHVYPNFGKRELPHSEIVAFRTQHAKEDEAQWLGLGTSQIDRRIYAIRNVLWMAESVVQVSDIALPQSLFPGLTRSRLEDAAPTLYGAYQVLFGITIVRTEDRLSAAPASPEIAKLLTLEPGSPILRIHRIARSVDHRPVEIRSIYIRTDKYHLLHEQGGLA